MTVALDDFPETARRVIDDLRVASNRFHLLEEVNATRGAVEGTPAEGFLFCIHDALVHRSVAALLRTVDDQRNAAHVSTLVSMLDDPSARSAIVSRLWGHLRRHGPNADGRDYLDPSLDKLAVETAHARTYLDAALTDLSGKSERIRRDGKFRRFRNREMAHAAIARVEPSPVPASREDWPRLERERLLRDYPSFRDLERAIGLADDMRRNLSFLTWGVVPDPGRERRAIRRGCRPVLEVIAGSSRTER